jgi:hypothetical protein
MITMGKYNPSDNNKRAGGINLSWAIFFLPMTAVLLGMYYKTFLDTFLFPETIFLVLCDPSMNEL